MRKAGFKGIIPIPVTTFTDSGELDLDGIRSQVSFCLEAGAHGLLYPGVVSEFYALTDDERKAAAEAVVSAVDHKVPIALGVSAPSTHTAARYARDAAQLDVDAVMTMTPFVQHFFKPSLEFCCDHVRAVGEAAGVPVILQNARIGNPIPLNQLGSVIDALPMIRYLKQETSPSTHAISDALSVVGERLDGVFGGIGGVYLVNELDRGACGSMPAPALVDELVLAYEEYGRQGAEAAQARLDRLATLFTRELLYNVSIIKEILKRRGIIRSTRTRIAAPTMDSYDHADIGRMLKNANIA